MDYNRYFWKSGRNQRRRNAEERRNIRRIILAFLIMTLAGIITGALILLAIRLFSPGI